jgi:hypothetical protein
MQTNKPARQVIIDFIIHCLKNGEQRGNILVKAGKKWGISKSAFDRFLKTAKEQHSIAAEAIKKEMVAIDTAAAIEARKRDIMTADQRKEYLTIIINCKTDIKKFDRQFFQIVELPDGRKEFISMADKLKAISELNKMEGDYAPTKVAQTDKDGNNASPSINIIQVVTRELPILENES